MNYLNLETNLLHSPEYIGCKPVARATWLNLIMWCATQENGGRIVGAKDWGNRQWQQTCGVTLKEVQGADPLLSWDGDDLLVFRYPAESEAVLQAKREAGREGGLRSGEARRKQTRSTPSSSASSTPSTDASTEGNGREGKEREGKVGARPPIASGVDIPAEDDWRQEFWKHDMPPEYADHQFNKLQAKLWENVRDWRAKVKEIKSWWLRGDMAEWRSSSKPMNGHRVRECDIPGPAEGPDPLEQLREDFRKNV